MKTVILIDGDVLVYQIGLASERPINWGDDLWTLHADFAECRTALANKVETFVTALKADEVRFALSCSTAEGFRKELCPTYKSNRVNVRKPIVHQALRELLLSDYDTIVRPRLEADDVLGILATTPHTTEKRIIVSVDKDFRGVPCSFYRTSEETPAVEETSRSAALRFHALQTLTGDRVDGYVGIPGCGPKTAEKILDGVPDDQLWPAIMAAYTKAGLGEELALTNARLARILQHGDYETKTGKIKLWTPPCSTTSPTSHTNPNPATSPTSCSAVTARKSPSKTREPAVTLAPAQSATSQ